MNRFRFPRLTLVEGITLALIGCILAAVIWPVVEHVRAPIVRRQLTVEGKRVEQEVHTTGKQMWTNHQYYLLTAEGDFRVSKDLYLRTVPGHYEALTKRREILSLERP